MSVQLAIGKAFGLQAIPTRETAITAGVVIVTRQPIGHRMKQKNTQNALSYTVWHAHKATRAVQTQIIAARRFSNKHTEKDAIRRTNMSALFNLLATDFFFQILAHPVFKMWVTQKPNKVALWNIRHFEEKNGDYTACLKYSVRIFVE